MTRLSRRLTTLDATIVGLFSMIGAGVFAAFAPAARAVLPAGAGWALLAALALAAAVAFANATSSAQLAAQYPVAGGTYVYGRERLGPWAGYVAGWGFVIGKTASCAAMALTFATYAVPDGSPGWVRRVVAAAAVAAICAVNYRGVTRTARVARWIVAAVLIILVVAMVVAWAGTASAGIGPRLLLGGTDAGSAWGGLYGVLQAAGLLFFAFAGYARVATLGEEVIDPRRAIPRAITVSFAVVAALYAAIAVTLLATLGLEGLAASSAPVAYAVEASMAGGVSWAAGWAPIMVRVGAALAAGGALMALVAGIARTALAMARERDLPSSLAAVHPRFGVPHRAEVVLAGIVIALVLTVDLRGAIGFSSFGVLIYYLVANLAARTQASTDRLYPRWFQTFGAVACTVLVLTLPWQSVAVGLGVMAVGLGIRALRLRRPR
ncbi:MAG: APC family permease [Promicromonosporaceae bacterium]|nr:APC family permease [Promicromonosporaceae bacterium]